MGEIVKKYYERIHFILIGLLVLFPITPRGIQSSLIITLFVVSLVHFFLEGITHWTRNKTILLISLGSISIIYIISLFHSTSVNEGVKFVIRLSPTLLIAFTFLTQKSFRWEYHKLQVVLYLYTASLLLFLIYLHISTFEIIANKNLSSWHLRDRIDQLTEVHGTYLSIWIGFAIVCGFWFVIKNINKKIFLIANVVIICYFFYWIYLIGARMPILATIVSLGWLLLDLWKVSNKTKIFAVGSLICICVTVFWNPILNKVNEMRNYENAIPEGKYENTNPLISNENIRSVIYHCALKKIEERPILGYGIGRVNSELQECYDEEFNHTDLFTRFKFNAHSQYLQLVLTLGIFGITLFVTSIICWFRSSSLKLYHYFLALILLSFAFENVLNRHDGIIFFSVFNAILLMSKKNQV
ncbi:O-antigen ligase [uncultured Aquimarina sp.]|uniref:O-antigen ligase family protein n=1 Tax=uncultured Aquimarina sp. TaxID=575652 RepID=UPI00261406B3|nr:O-antigen ligase family protein [uncultured Aquimarina sp.]